MNKDILFKLCDKFYMITEYPIAVFQEDELFYSCGYELEYSELPGMIQFWLRNQNDSSTFQYHWKNQSILVIYFAVLNTNVSIMIGPLLTVHMKENDIRRLLRVQESATSDKSNGTLELFVEYLKRMRPVKGDAVFNYSEFFYMAVNKSIPDSKRLVEGKEKEITEKEKIDGRPVERMEVFYSEKNIQYVEKLSYLIQNGLVGELEKFIAVEHEFPYGKLGPNVLRHQKNSCITSVYIVRKAAQAGGLNEQLCLRMAEGYTQRFELARNPTEVYQISKDMMRDYCRRVHELNKLQVCNKTIAKAIKYIHHHRMERINAVTIAEAVGVSYSYLCSQFKKETGSSVITFIQQEKISAAKDLLLFSELSLGEIAESLSFSSQSYFQSVFKKIELCTPMEYRQQRK